MLLFQTSPLACLPTFRTGSLAPKQPAPASLSLQQHDIPANVARFGHTEIFKRSFQRRTQLQVLSKRGWKLSRQAGRQSQTLHSCRCPTRISAMSWIKHSSASAGAAASTTVSHTLALMSGVTPASGVQSWPGLFEVSADLCPEDFSMASLEHPSSGSPAVANLLGCETPSVNPVSVCHCWQSAQVSCTVQAVSTWLGHVQTPEEAPLPARSEARTLQRHMLAPHP